MRARGIVIAFLGPDGAGKTAIGDLLEKSLSHKFCGVSRFHLRPNILGRGQDKNGVSVINPHGKEPRGIVLSLVKLIYFLFDYTLGYWLCIRPLKNSSRLVLFDRYYQDLLVDPKRYRYGAPMWIARMFGLLMPKPDLFIILDAPAEVIHARKQEVPLDETKRQREAYLAFANEQSNCIVLNTSQSLDMTVQEGYLAVMDYMYKTHEGSKQEEAIIQKIFLSEPVSKGASSYDKAEKYFVISGHNGPRWVIPAKSLLGKQVLAQWHPYNFFSQIAWFVFRILYFCRVAALMPSIKSIMIDTVQELKIPGNDIKVTPVIYVGTPGAQQKTVVTFVNVSNGYPLAIMKAALGPCAYESLKREAKILESLTQLGVKNVPKLLSVDEEKECSWQSVVYGKLTSRKLSDIHIDWLLSLPMTGKTTTFDEQKKILQQSVKNGCKFLSVNQLKDLNIYIERINSKREIPFILVHGDFAPWNLKLNSERELAVIDWEDAKLEGLPLWDLCHFYFIQAHLFNEKNRIKNFFMSQLLDKYLNALGLDEKEKNYLVYLYLLGMIVKNTGYVSVGYREFLLEQLPMVYG